MRTNYTRRRVPSVRPSPSAIRRWISANELPPEPRYDTPPAACQHTETFCPGIRQRDYTVICAACGSVVADETGRGR